MTEPFSTVTQTRSNSNSPVHPEPVERRNKAQTELLTRSWFERLATGSRIPALKGWQKKYRAQRFQLLYKIFFVFFSR
jgi:hypothetical protein